MKKKFNYNVEKNYKFLKEMEPKNYDFVMIWLSLFLGVFFYEFFPDKESLLGLLGFVFLYKSVFCLIWCIHDLVHLIICKKRGVKPDGSIIDNNVK